MATLQICPSEDELLRGAVQEVVGLDTVGRLGTPKYLKINQ